MKTKLLVVALMGASLAPAAQYQACMISTKTGDISCTKPQSKHDAEQRALVVQAVAGGEVIVWVEKYQKPHRPKKGDAPSIITLTPAPLPSQVQNEQILN